MKNLFKNLMLVAVAAMAFTACTEEQNEVNAVKEKVTITFTADFGEDTRVSLDNSENDKVYKAAWEAGDKVTFVVFENAETNTHKEISNPITIATAGDTAEFTVTFNNGLVEGNVIKAYVNYSVYEDYYGWFVCEPEWYQYPSNDGPSAIYASASVVYQAGIDYTKLSFTHDYAYGLMTIENAPFTLSNVDFIEFNIDGKTTSVYTDYLEGGDKVWFYCDEDTNVEEFQIHVMYDNYESECFFSRSFDEEGQFAFKQGRVSRFTVSTWKSKLAMPEVETTVSGKTITLNWASVEGADGYIVKCGYSKYNILLEDLVTENQFEYTIEDATQDHIFMIYAYANDDNTKYITSNYSECWVTSDELLPKMTLSSKSLSFDAEGGAEEIVVDLQNIEGGYTVVNELDWITTASGENGVLTVTAAANNVAEARNGSILIQAAGVDAQEVKVSQRAFGAAKPDGTEANPYTFKSAVINDWLFNFTESEDNASLQIDRDTKDMSKWVGKYYFNNYPFYTFVSGHYYKVNGNNYGYYDYCDNSYLTGTANGDGSYTFNIAISVDGGETYTYYIGVINE